MLSVSIVTLISLFHILTQQTAQSLPVPSLLPYSPYSSSVSLSLTHLSHISTFNMPPTRSASKRSRSRSKTPLKATKNNKKETTTTPTSKTKAINKVPRGGEPEGGDMTAFYTDSGGTYRGEGLLRNLGRKGGKPNPCSIQQPN